MNLITVYIIDYFHNCRNIANPLKFAAIGMIIFVAVYYPVFEFLQKKIEYMTRRIIKKVKSRLGKTFGYIIVFSVLTIHYTAFMQL